MNHETPHRRPRRLALIATSGLLAAGVVWGAGGVIAGASSETIDVPGIEDDLPPEAHINGQDVRPEPEGAIDCFEEQVEDCPEVQE